MATYRTCAFVRIDGLAADLVKHRRQTHRNDDRMAAIKRSFDSLEIALPDRAPAANRISCRRRFHFIAGQTAAICFRVGKFVQPGDTLTTEQRQCAHDIAATVATVRITLDLVVHIRGTECVRRTDSSTLRKPLIVTPRTIGNRPSDTGTLIALVAG